MSDLNRAFCILCLLICSYPLFSFSSEEDDFPQAPLIKKSIQTFMQEKDIPGVSLAVVYKGQSYLFQFGWADRELKNPVTSSTIFAIGSITKVFTSTALAIEVLAHKTTLNAPLINYLPINKQRVQIGRITLLELATHTSSLPRSLPPFKNKKEQPASVRQFLSRWTPSYPIGTRYAYSNLGFGLLGEAVANVAGMGYEQTIAQFITTPLQMDSTFAAIPPSLASRYAQGYLPTGARIQRPPPIQPHPYKPSFLPGGGALRSTNRDMLKFLEANLGLSGPAYLLQAMQLAQQGFFKVNQRLTLGLGWQRFQSAHGLILDKNGGVPGFSSYIGFKPEQKIGVVILANKSKTQITSIGRLLLKQLSSR